jgi:site-specific recombinase XerD
VNSLSTRRSLSIPKSQSRLTTNRTMLMMLYATGLRRAEMCHLKVSEIDSKRMVIHVRQGKGGRDRDVLLTRSC